MSAFCAKTLPALVGQVKVAPDPSQTIAENTMRWIWVDHEQSFCQLYPTGNVAVRCDCTGCAHNEDHVPERPGHKGDCDCLECVCPGRRLTGRYTVGVGYDNIEGDGAGDGGYGGDDNGDGGDDGGDM
jgi:hypothetical protein